MRLAIYDKDFNVPVYFIDLNVEILDVARALDCGVSTLIALHKEKEKNRRFEGICDATIRIMDEENEGCGSCFRWS